MYTVLAKKQKSINYIIRIKIHCTNKINIMISTFKLYYMPINEDKCDDLSIFQYSYYICIVS